MAFARLRRVQQVDAVLPRAAGLDEFHAAEAEGRPILINGDGPDWFEARLAESLPAGVAIDLALVPLGGFLRLPNF